MGIQDSSGFWIHAVNYRFQPSTGFQIICQWNLDSGFQSSVRSGFLELHFRFQTPGFRIPEAKTCGRPIKKFPGIQIPLYGAINNIYLATICH